MDEYTNGDVTSLSSDYFGVLCNFDRASELKYGSTTANYTQDARTTWANVYVFTPTGHKYAYTRYQSGTASTVNSQLASFMRYDSTSTETYKWVTTRTDGSPIVNILESVEEAGTVAAGSWSIADGVITWGQVSE